ncbi:MAG: hypothetical protein RJA22_2389 [Verrucomicrobiota bacterium]|jgi:hypothetical protein
MIAPVLLAAGIRGEQEIQALQDAAQRSKSWFSGDSGLVLGSIGLVVAALLFWVVFIRRRPTHQRGSLVVTRNKRGDNTRYNSSGRRRRRRRRPGHPDNFGRNPTLGETGGLPPPRPEDSGPSPAAPGSPS